LNAATIFIAPGDIPHFLWASGNDTWHAQTIYQQQQPQATYTLQQTVTVPDEASAPTLALLYRLEGSYGDQGSAFSLLVDDGQSQTFLSTTRENTEPDGWDLAWADLSPWAGQQVQVGMALSQAAGQVCARAIVDEVSLGAGAHPELWTLGDVAIGGPGEEVTFLIRYGNQGDAPAPNARLRIQPPPELALVTADPPPTSQEDAWVWELGDLPAGGGEQIIRVIARIDPAASPAAVLRAPVEIATDALELNDENNRAELITFVSGHRLFLPWLEW
jgi:hypothetical protein